MPAYHSSQNKKEYKSIGNIAILGFKASNSKGPAPRFDGEGDDIIDEVLKYFKANCFFQNYEIKGNADRLLVYLTLYAHQCVCRCTRAASADGCTREMYQLAIENFTLPFENGFPLKQMYKSPDSKQQQDELRSYLLQCRQELGTRIVERMCRDGGKPSKWWLCFSKRKFMGKSLEAPGRF